MDRFDPEWRDILAGRGSELCLRISPAQKGHSPSKGQLVVCVNDQIEATIQRLNDLAPYVHLDSEEKAIYFLRLRTSFLARWTRFDSWLGWEIRADGTVGPGPGLGKIDPALLPTGLKDAVITRSGDHWHVTRYIAVPGKTCSAGFDEVVKLTEKVSPCGQQEDLERETVYSGDLGIQRNIRPSPFDGTYPYDR